MQLAAVLALCAALSVQAQDGARFTEKGELIRPGNYREWVFLSSGLGMTYGPSAPAPGARLRFDNVFVNPSAYREFLRTGGWPDGTVLILEIRESESKGSINRHGHYQANLVAVEANVKDSRRFAKSGGWAFFDLGSNSDARPVSAIPPGNRCQECHTANGAVDSTFVQFYPDLAAVAKKFGTFRATAVSEARH